MTSARRLVPILVLLVLAVACGKAQRTIVGTWKWNDSKENKSGADVGHRFGDDGKWEYWYRSLRITDEVSGTYKYENGVLTLHQERHVSRDGKVSEEPNTSTVEIEWVTDDRIIMSESGSSLTYERVPASP